MADSRAWYDNWQHRDHAVFFDGRSRLTDRNLIKTVEKLNDIHLLIDRLRQAGGGTPRLAEIGCATAEVYRYLRLKFPQVDYYGFDISEVAIERGRAKYPQAKLFVNQPGGSISEAFRRAGLRGKPELIYCKDVVHHQVKPWDLLDALVRETGQTLVLRLRTRDAGATEWDPEQSCQYHYGTWVPYIVINLDEVVAHLQALLPKAELTIVRHHMILGGHWNRFLPKACYLKETGTAETSVGVYLATAHPGRVTIQDRVDNQPETRWDKVVRQVRQGVGTVLKQRPPARAPASGAAR